MKMSRKLLSIILAIMMVITIVPLTASAATSGTCGDNLTWSYDTSTYTLTISGTGAMEDYGESNRPWEEFVSYEDEFYDSYGDYYCTGPTGIQKVIIESGVASISENAFYSCNYLTDVTVADTVKFIGSYAFYSCYNLKNINIPDSVKLISDYAFYYCDGLTSITIPDSVMSIGAGAFSDCGSLKTVNITDLSAWCNITFNDSSSNPLCYGADLYLDGTKVTDLVIPEDVTKLNAYAFYNCDSLESVTIPDSVKSIGDTTFNNCTNLEGVTIGDGVTSIYDYAFSNCTSLTSIIIPDSVTSIGDYAFSNCTSLKTAKIGKNVVYMPYHDINRSSGEYYYVFKNCTSLESITVDKENQYYSSDDYGALFNKNKTNLYVYPVGNTRTSYSIPDTVTTVADGAFANAKNLIEVSIPDSVHELGLNYVLYSGTHYGRAFQNCSSLKTITIPNGVSTIYEYTFDGCTALEEITIPDSVKCIYEYAFKDCLELSDVYYTDTEENWKKISINSHNEWLIVATKHFEGSHSHSFGAWETTTGGCGTITQTRTCSICGYVETQTTEGSHNFTEWRYDYGTCGVNGTEYRYCSKCGTYEYRDLTAHTFSDWYVMEGSCGNMGQERRRCTKCGTYEYRDTEMIEHNFGEWKVTKDATCSASGVEMSYCSKCGGAQQRDIPAKGHTPADEFTVDVTATCTTDGSKSQHCTVCDAKTNVTVIKADGHNFNTVEVTAPTCTTNGVSLADCTACPEITVMTVPATGHNYVDGVCVNCTGNTSGGNTKPTCTIHNYTWETVVEASCTQEGVCIGTCTVCEDIAVDYHDATGHSYEPTIIAPTCTEQGYTAYTCACGDSYNIDYVDSLGHNPASAVEENYVAPTCTEKGSKDFVVYCSVCNEEISRETVILETTGHNVVDGDCTNCDYTENTGNEDNNDNDVADPSDDCDCNCHKSGIQKFFFDFILLFQRIFGTNKECVCGVAHY